MFMLTSTQIAEIREALSLTVVEFAAKIGVSRKTIYQWESGLRHPRWALLEKINELAKSAKITIPA